MSHYYFTPASSASPQSGSGSSLSSDGSRGRSSAQAMASSSRMTLNHLLTPTNEIARPSGIARAFDFSFAKDTGSRATSLDSLGSSSSEEESETDSRLQNQSIPQEMKLSPKSPKRSEAERQTSRELRATQVADDSTSKRKLPRISDLFPPLLPVPDAQSTLYATANVVTPIPVESSYSSTDPHSHVTTKGHQKICYEAPCCGRYPNIHSIASSSSHSSRPEEGISHADLVQTLSQRRHEMFWKRQTWLMQFRGADGESDCGSDSAEDEVKQEGEDIGLSGHAGKAKEDWEEYLESSSGSSEGKAIIPASSTAHSVTTARKRARVVPSPRKRNSVKRRRAVKGINETAPKGDVLRTAGAGLPLARVKRVMKGADEQIKMISHESPALLSRLCTVLISDLTVRAGRNALLQGRRTLTRSDLWDVCVGTGEGADAEWEFLRDVIENGKGAESTVSE